MFFQIHFEECQFESKRADGWKKLKPNAVPTLFNVPNPPPRIDPGPRKSVYKQLPTNRIGEKQLTFEPELNLDQEISNGTCNDLPETSHHEEAETLSLSNSIIAKLQQENNNLRQQLQDARGFCHAAVQQENQELIKKDTLAKFLNKDQLKILQEGRLSQWNSESIIKALKFRFAMGVHGYEYLRKSGYPLPAYSTIMRKIQDLKLDFGIFDDVLELLSFKVLSMEEIDKFVVLSYDEMWISEGSDFDKNTQRWYGDVTLGKMPDDDNKKLEMLSKNEKKKPDGQKIFLVVVRGIKTRWKQVMACHVTPKGEIDKNQVQKFMLDCISRVEDCGLQVVLLSSDLDGRNRTLWKSFNIDVGKNGLRVNSFLYNNHDVYAMPDPCHLLKNLKAAMLRQTLYLPDAFIELENLPTNEVSGSYIVRLWNFEMLKGEEKRLLHHIKQEDIEPSNFDKMHVGAAVRFFSSKTASALKTAVALNILPNTALTTAAFILIIEKWFSIVASKTRKASITTRNCDQKYIFLHSVIDLFQDTVFEAGWKPLNYGFVLATLSFCDVVEYLFLKQFDFILGDRFLQDGTENIFSQIRKKYGKMPTALQCLRAIKGISVSQFVSDCKRTSYMNDSDEHLLDFCAKKRKRNHNVSSSSNNEQQIEPPSKERNTSTDTSNFCIQTYEINDFSEWISRYEANSIFYLAGSTTNSVIKHVCEECIQYLKSSNLPVTEFIKKAKLYTKGVDKGGLKEPCKQTLCLIFHCEHYFNLYKNVLMRTGNCGLIKKLYDDVNIEFPKCCQVKLKIITHFFKVRSFCVKNYFENCKSRTKVYASATMK